MNIVFDNIIFDLQRAGGISKFWAKHIDYINKQNLDCTFLESYKAVDNIFRKEIFPSSKVNTINMRHKLFPLTRYLPVKFNCNTNSVFHSSYFRNPKNKCVPTIHTVHDFMYEKFEHGAKRALHVYQKKSAMRRADVIVCVSNKTMLDMYDLYPWTKEKRVEVIYNGVDDEFFPIVDRQKIIKIGDIELVDKGYLLYVGSRGYCKNFPFVISLMHSEFVSDHNLKLVCVGGGEFSSEEKKMLTDSGLIKKIIKLDGINSKLLNVLYNSARALLIPSIYEGFGIPALEAAKTGCIVLGANNSSIPEVVGDSPFLFSPFDLNQAKICLERLDNTDLHEKVRDEQLNFSKAFSWSNMSRNYIKLYEELLWL